MQISLSSSAESLTQGWKLRCARRCVDHLVSCFPACSLSWIAESFPLLSNREEKKKRELWHLSRLAASNKRKEAITECGFWRKPATLVGILQWFPCLHQQTQYSQSEVKSMRSLPLFFFFFLTVLYTYIVSFSDLLSDRWHQVDITSHSSLLRNKIRLQ